MVNKSVSSTDQCQRALTPRWALLAYEQSSVALAQWSAPFATDSHVSPASRSPRRIGLSKQDRPVIVVFHGRCPPLEPVAQFVSVFPVPTQKPDGTEPHAPSRVGQGRSASEFGSYGPSGLHELDIESDGDLVTNQDATGL